MVCVTHPSRAGLHRDLLPVQVQDPEQGALAGDWLIMWCSLLALCNFILAHLEVVQVKIKNKCQINLKIVNTLSKYGHYKKLQIKKIVNINNLHCPNMVIMKKFGRKFCPKTYRTVNF